MLKIAECDRDDAVKFLGCDFEKSRERKIESRLFILLFVLHAMTRELLFRRMDQRTTFMTDNFTTQMNVNKPHLLRIKIYNAEI